MSKVEKKSEVEVKAVTIPQAAMHTVIFKITGMAPLVMHRFGAKARKQLEAIHTTDKSQRGNKTSRPPRNYKDEFEEAKHVSADGWEGIPATSIRKAMITACKLSDFKMTIGKLAFTIKEDGWDNQDMSPLVKITKGKSVMDIRPVKLKKGGTDMRSRPMLAPGWEALVRIVYDTHQFTDTDIANLLDRAGAQCGICEGRPSSESGGCGWGLFRIAD